MYYYFSKQNTHKYSFDQQSKMKHRTGVNAYANTSYTPIYDNFYAMTCDNKRLKLCKVRSIIAITLSLSNIRAIQAPCKYLFDAWVLFQFQSAFVPLVLVLKVAHSLNCIRHYMN